MKLDDAFKTKTMARIFVEQGRFKEAFQIYAHLIRKNPDQRDIQAEIAALKLRINTPPGKGVRDLRVLYRQWISLVINRGRGSG
jgi:hypothetical protein